MDQLIQALDTSAPGLGDYSLSNTIFALLLAFALGHLIGWTYIWTHSGLSYARSFTQSLVLMTMVVALVMLVIGNSIATAFGLLGALALIRFRNVLKDTRDTVFVFMSLVCGMAVGSQRYVTAIVGTLALMLVVAYLSVSSFGSTGRYDGYLTLRLSSEGGKRLFGELLDRFCRAVKQVSIRQAGDQAGAEYVYQVGLRDRGRTHELIQQLRELEGVTHVSLVIRDELSEA